MLTNEAIEELKKLYMQEYKISLTDKQALDFGTSLIGLVKAVYGDNLPVAEAIDSEAKKDNN